LEDTHALIDALARDRIIDPRRVAVMGHSHGGAMAYYYLTHSTRFCGVVAVNGRADWILQAKYHSDGLLPDILGGTPDSLPERYREFSPALNARRATAALLAVSGAHDTQILPQNAAIMVDSMKANGKDATLLAFPDEGHLLNNPGNRQRFWDAALALLGRACHMGD
jgi:dipeptidyl aminopeptidase/acylaminoacyl peptidase